MFEEWLSEKLKSLELDTDIYVDYFCSVLDETQTDNEIKESLQDILEGVLVRLEIIKFEPNTTPPPPTYRYLAVR